MANIIVTDGTAEDYDSVLALNEDAVPHVNSIGVETLARLHAQSLFLGIARGGDDVVGFLLALNENADYGSENYAYFKRRYPRFAYVDRIVVASTGRRAGVGAALYAALTARVPADCPWLTCEVNVRPPNPESLAFHHKLGFASVGEQETGGGAKRVCLLAKPLP